MFSSGSIRLYWIGALLLVLATLIGWFPVSRAWLIRVLYLTTATPTRLQFVDVSQEAGLTVVSWCGEPAKDYIIEAHGNGTAFADYDGDGDLDLYFVVGSTMAYLRRPNPEAANRLYRNNGDGTFTDVTESAGVGDSSWGMGCAFADYDNDGDLDLYVTNYGPNVLYRNNGDGTFSDVTESAGVGDSSWSTGCLFVDYDRDGYLDLYLASYLQFDGQTRPTARFHGIEVYAGPHGFQGGADRLYHNNGDGTFTDVTEPAGIAGDNTYYGLGVTASDYDNDGDPDIYVANDATPNVLFQNNGDGTFTDVALLAGVSFGEMGEAEAGMGVDFGDYNNDGNLDLFVTNFSHETNTLYRNNGDGTFTDVVFTTNLGYPSLPMLSWGTRFFDYDNDGDQDLFVANGHVYPQVDGAGIGTTYGQLNQLFENLGEGTFAEVSASHGSGFKVAKSSRGACFGDYDNDGDVDVVVVNIDDTPTLLRNDGGNRNHWLAIRTVGTRSNRDGVGTRIKVTAGGHAQVKEVGGGASYLSHNDLRVYFGLARHAQVDLIEVRWPSGLVETLYNVSANQYLVLTEGQQAASGPLPGTVATYR